MRAREDLHSQPIPADLTLFVGGSCFRDATGYHAGYAIVQSHSDNTSTQIQQPCSAQLAEIRALTAACNLAQDKRLNVYTDSAYAYGVCHVHGNIWKQQHLVFSELMAHLWLMVRLWQHCLRLCYYQLL